MIKFDERVIRNSSMMGMGPSFWGIGVKDILKNNDNVRVLSADLARYSGMDRLFKLYPDRCYNVGIAEQNMVGIAAGMAMEGMQVFMTTYAPFMTYRCADQMRHLMGNCNLNIKAIGSAAGFSSGWSGNALLSIGDISFARSIPNMTVLCPADAYEAVKMAEAMSAIDGPVYMRYSGGSTSRQVYTADYPFEIGKAVTLKKGKDVTIICVGTDIVAESVKAADILKNKAGVDATVINMHTIKPLDEMCIDALATDHKHFVTVEENSIIGGLGSAVAEYLAKKDYDVKQLCIGIEDRCYQLGSRDYMLGQAGLLADDIADSIMEAVNRYS